MTALPDAELEAIEARANAATKGPWRVNGPGMQICDFGLNDDGSISTITIPPSSDAMLLAQPPRHDADFIAHARTDIPALIAEVRRLRDALDTVCGTENVAIDEVEIRGLTPIQADRVREAFANQSHEVRRLRKIEALAAEHINSYGFLPDEPTVKRLARALGRKK